MRRPPPPASSDAPSAPTAIPVGRTGARALATLLSSLILLAAPALAQDGSTLRGSLDPTDPTAADASATATETDPKPARPATAQILRITPTTATTEATPTVRLERTRGRTATTPQTGRTPIEPVRTTGSISAAARVQPLPATQPRPRDPLADKRVEAGGEDDDWAQLGLRTGNFTWLPAVEASVGESSNVATKAGGTSGLVYRVAPELIGRSDWSRHALQLELRGAYLGNAVDSDYDKPTLQARATGRIDLGDETKIDVKTGYARDRQSPSSADNPADTVVPATLTTTTASLGLTRDVGLLAVTLRGDVERADYSGGTTSSGATLGADIQNNTRWIGALRTTYGTPGSLRPFAEVQVSARDYDDPIVSGSPRDSTGGALKVGVVADLGPTLRGEISTGWGVERPNAGPLPDISGWLVDGSLIWTPTRLTTVKIDAKTSFEPTTLAAATGAVGRSIAIGIDHALRRNLVASVGVALVDKDYVGVKLREDDLVLSTGLTYKFDRNVQTFVKGSWEHFTSTTPGAGYDAATVMVGVRLQR